MEIPTLIAAAAILGFVAGVMLTWLALGDECRDRGHTITAQGKLIADLLKQQRKNYWSDTTPSDRAMESHLAIYGLNEPQLATPAEAKVLDAALAWSRKPCTCGAGDSPGEWHITWCERYIDPQAAIAPVIFEREC